VHRIDPAEIVGIQNILPAGPGGGLFADELLQQIHHRIEHVHHGNVQALAGRLQFTPQRPIDQGGKHRPRLMLHAFHHAMQLETRPDQAPAVIHNLRMLELNRGGTSNCIQGLAGGVGDQVQVDAVTGHGDEDSGDNGACHQE
jgi:hypothetical protein